MNTSVEPLVSVIVPCYQQEAFIGEALQSVCVQTYQNWECIVVDDGSFDSSKDIVLGFAKTDNRIQYIFQENSGVSKARNTGFLNSRGDYICFLDGDDLITPEKINRQVHYFLDHPETNVCYSDHVHRFDQKGIDEHYESVRLGPSPLEDFLLSWDRGLSIPPHCGMFRRSIWNEGEVPFNPDYHARWEDWVFWIELCLRGCQFSFLNFQDAIYRIHATNFSGELQQASENAIRAAFFVAPKLPEEIRDQFLSETIAFHMERYGKLLANNQLRQSVLFKTLKKLSKPLDLVIGKRRRANLRRLFLGS